MFLWQKKQAMEFYNIRSTKLECPKQIECFNFVSNIRTFEHSDFRLEGDVFYVDIVVFFDNGNIFLIRHCLRLARARFCLLGFLRIARG